MSQGNPARLNHEDLLAEIAKLAASREARKQIVTLTAADGTVQAFTLSTDGSLTPKED